MLLPNASAHSVCSCRQGSQTRARCLVLPAPRLLLVLPLHEKEQSTGIDAAPKRHHTTLNEGEVQQSHCEASSSQQSVSFRSSSLVTPGFTAQTQLGAGCGDVMAGVTTTATTIRQSLAVIIAVVGDHHHHHHHYHRHHHITIIIIIVVVVGVRSCEYTYIHT